VTIIKIIKLERCTIRKSRSVCLKSTVTTTRYQVINAGQCQGDRVVGEGTEWVHNESGGEGEYHAEGTGDRVRQFIQAAHDEDRGCAEGVPEEDRGLPEEDLALRERRHVSNLTKKNTVPRRQLKETADQPRKERQGDQLPQGRSRHPKEINPLSAEQNKITPASCSKLDTSRTQRKERRAHLCHRGAQWGKADPQDQQ